MKNVGVGSASGWLVCERQVERGPLAPTLRGTLPHLLLAACPINIPWDP